MAGTGEFYEFAMSPSNICVFNSYATAPITKEEKPFLQTASLPKEDFKGNFLFHENHLLNLYEGRTLLRRLCGNAYEIHAACNT